MKWVDNVDGVDFDGYVVANGSLCLMADRRTRIYTHAIDADDAKRFIEFVPDCQIPVVVIPADGDIFFTSEPGGGDSIAGKLRMPHTPVKPISTAEGKEIVQLMAFGDDGQRRASGLMGNVLRHCDTTSSNPYFCDIVPAGSNKGIGIEKMAAHFGIGIEETAAFGDGENDIEMLGHAGVSFAMANASDAVKNAADHIAGDVSGEGVIAGLRLLFPSLF